MFPNYTAMQWVCKRKGFDMSADYVYKKPNGETISCYGECIPENNFDIVCDNEWYDGVWCGDDHHEVTTWRRLCEYLTETYRKDIVQIEAV